MRNTRLGSTILASALLLSIGCPGGQTQQEELGEVEGSVSDSATGAALAGAEVTLDGNQKVTTDGAGAFAFHRLAVGVHRFEAAKDGYASPTPASVRVESGKTASLALRLDPSLGRIVGTVTDAGSGTAIAGATVATNPASAQGVTDDRGRFTLEVAPGTFTVHAAAESYEAADSSEVQVAAGGSVTVDLSLSPALTYDTTCEGCHLQLAALVASLEADPIPEAPPTGGSAGEG